MLKSDIAYKGDILNPFAKLLCLMVSLQPMNGHATETCSFLDFVFSGKTPGNEDVRPFLNGLTARLERYRELSTKANEGLLDEVIANTDRSKGGDAPPSIYEQNRQELKSISEVLLSSTSWIERSVSDRYSETESECFAIQVPYVANESRSVYDVRSLVKAAREISAKYSEALTRNQAYREVVQFRQELTAELKVNDRDLGKVVIKQALDSSVLSRLEKLHGEAQDRLTNIIPKIERIRDNLRRQKQELEYKIEKEADEDSNRRRLAATEKDLLEVVALLPPRNDKSQPLLDQVIAAENSPTRIFILPNPR